jgi:hypothetical protein
MQIRHFNRWWQKISNPLKYCSLLILIHWLVLFPIAYYAGGHPPAVYVFFELPTVILLNFFTPMGPFAESIFFIVFPTITYGLLGFLFGIFLNKKHIKTTKSVIRQNVDASEPK